MKSNRYAAYDEYGLRYLPRHLTRSGRWKDLVDKLTDFDFLEVKCRVISVYELEEDYQGALADRQGEPSGRMLLEAFDERLRLESHHIQQAPYLLFPHLYNHLTWLDAPDGPIHQICEQERMGRVDWLRAVQDPRPASPVMAE
jgi:hypothetical protein